MRYINFLTSLCVVLSIASCSKIGAGIAPPPQVKTLIPGECLASTELSYYVPDEGRTPILGEYFYFGFGVEYSGLSEERTDKKIVTNMTEHWRIIPSDDMFSCFGANKDDVKNEFEQVFEDFSESYYRRFKTQNYSVATILCNGDISLVADKEFAGRPAGEDLGGLIDALPIYADNTPSEAGGFLKIPLDCDWMIGEDFGLCIPTGEHKLTDESVKFELKVPVKIVYYLTWLNDKLSDPDAVVPYNDEVLHCIFTSPYGLK